MTTTMTPTRAGRREWVGLAVLALPTFLVSLDVFVLILALPKLSQSLGADSTQQLWIMDVYGFMIAGFMVTMGTLGDRTASFQNCCSSAPRRSERPPCSPRSRRAR